jgi:imidazolonepropionase-like amidohydrolase
VGPEKDVKPPVGASVEEFNYPDHTVMPGLVDTHTHLNGFGDGRVGDDLATLPDEILVLQTARNLYTTLYSGVTSVRDNGGKNQTTLMTRQALDMGIIQGPRIVLCIRPIAITGGHMYYFGSVADGVDAARAEVRKLIMEGADYIKITATGGSTRTSFRLRPSFTVEELSAMSSEAQKFGKLTAAHCSCTQGIINCLDAGIDMIIHCDFKEPDGTLHFREDVAERIGQQEVYVNPTLHVLRSQILKLEKKEQREGLTVKERQTLDVRRRDWDGKLEHVGRLISMGLKVVAGSDSSWGDYPLGGFVYEIEALVQAGFNPIQAIISATGKAAEAIGIGEITGTLQPDMAADILVVKGNPLRDINELWNVAGIFQNGNLLRTLE